MLRCSTDICPKELTRDMRGYFNSLLGDRQLNASLVGGNLEEDGDVADRLQCSPVCLGGHVSDTG